MVQKIAIMILVLALLMAGAGVLIYLKKSEKNLVETPTDKVQTIEKKTETAPVATSTPQRPPTEAEIAEYVTSTTKQINEEILNKPMTADQLRFLRNPRAEAVKRLSN